MLRAMQADNPGNQTHHAMPGARATLSFLPLAVTAIGLCALELHPLVDMKGLGLFSKRACLWPGKAPIPGCTGLQEACPNMAGDPGSDGSDRYDAWLTLECSRCWMGAAHCGAVLMRCIWLGEEGSLDSEECWLDWDAWLCCTRSWRRDGWDLMGRCCGEDGAGPFESKQRVL